MPSRSRSARPRRRIGVADTTFARWDMGRAVVDELASRTGDFDVVRVTVPGIKDLPVACKRLIEEKDCDIVVACGYVGGAAIDRECANVADHAIQRVQLMTNVHVLGVFVYETEAKDARELAWLCDRRAREHAVNAWRLLFKPEELAAMAGTGKRQGFADAGPIEATLRERRVRRK
ncbi:MAG: riboflavin synthase [Methanobacteriota archaeon]|nr:MAG: riboflavin synthase [Euryarchaeota archaeon]